MTSEEHRVLDIAGDQAIGILHRASSSAESGVVVVVGGPQFRVGSHRQFLRLAREIADAGFPVLRFDVRGMGDSDGDARRFDALDEDIRCAVDELCLACSSIKQVVLVGLCDGASAALMYAPSDNRVAALALLNPWARSEAGSAKVRLRSYYLRRVASREFWRKLLSGGVSLGGSAGELADAARSAVAGAASAGFLDRMEEAAASYRGDMLTLLSDKDYTADEFRQWIAGTERRTKAFSRGGMAIRTISEANHTFSTAESHSAMSDAILRLLSSLPKAT